MNTTTIDGRKYEVHTKTGKRLTARSCKPVISSEEQKRRSEYVTRRCADILRIHG